MPRFSTLLSSLVSLFSSFTNFLSLFSNIFICFHSGFGWDLRNARLAQELLYVVFIGEIFTCTFRFRFHNASFWFTLCLSCILGSQQLEYCNNSKSLIGYSRIMDWLFGIESAWISQLQIPKNNILVLHKIVVKSHSSCAKVCTLNSGNYQAIWRTHTNTNTREKYFWLHL